MDIKFINKMSALTEIRHDIDISINVTAISINMDTSIRGILNGFTIERFIGWLLSRKEQPKRYDIACLQGVWFALASQIIRVTSGYRYAFNNSPIGRFGVGGDGLATMTDWRILDKGRVPWLHNIGTHHLGFSYTRLQHMNFRKIQIVVYNVHGIWPEKYGDYIEDKVNDNMRQLGQHISQYARFDAVLVGGDFKWHHRLRPIGTRANEGPVDPRFHISKKRYDAFGTLMMYGGLCDCEWEFKKQYPWASGLERWFYKSGLEVQVQLNQLSYMGKGTPWYKICNCTPLLVEFRINLKNLESLEGCTLNHHVYHHSMVEL
jgi:hypothetical protein